MYTKIYIHNKPLYLCNALEDNISKLIHQPDTIFIDELNNDTIKSMLREMELPHINTGIFFHTDLEALQQAVFKKFEIIVAAGGVVFNENDEILMIYRRGFWDLPKGKVDDGESLEDAALREVSEETGLTGIKLKKLLETTYHVYEQGTHHILKESHWYRMKASSVQPLVPQTEEDIVDIKWMDLHTAEQHFHLAYPAIADVIKSIY